MNTFYVSVDDLIFIEKLCWSFLETDSDSQFLHRLCEKECVKQTLNHRVTVLLHRIKSSEVICKRFLNYYEDAKHERNS